MDQDQIGSTELSVKAPPNFDTIPEDVALTIVKSMQGWAEEEGNEEQREKGRKARDSTLRAAALTSSRTFETYLTSLIQHVSLDTMYLFSFLQALERGEPHRGALVRSIRLEQSIDYSCEENLQLLLALGETFITTTTTGAHRRFRQGLGVALGRCYQQVINLQSLVILVPFMSCFYHFHHKVGQQFRPHFFLSRSLKRLFIQLCRKPPSNNRYNPNLSAKNATWLLVFCRRIEMASLGFEMSVDDSEYLSEFAETFAGLSSVKKLAMRVNFVSKEEDKKTWWGAPEEENANHRGGNRTTESLFNLLQSTKQLEALEIYVPPSKVRDGDHSTLFLTCLSALSRSFRSLRHLRLIGVMFWDSSSSLLNLCSFQVLRVVTLEYGLVFAFSLVDLPQSIEIMCLPHYLIRRTQLEDQQEDEEDLGEERLIGNMIDNKCQPIFTSLKEVVVPSSPIGADGKTIVYPRGLQRWSQPRSELENADALRSGKVKLRKTEIGEVVGDASKGEVFWSTIRWLSPP